MLTAQIRFSTQILKRLGEELNPSPDQSILELVRNAHDADASTCTIELRNTDQSGGTILIQDDGVGMDLTQIKDGWLLLGESGKSAIQTTAGGRIPAGSKGLGRLAALRMGTIVTLTTRPSKDSLVEYSIRIDWRQYDGVKAVEDVDLVINEGSRGENQRQGTTITIENISAKLSRTDIKRLARSLILLASPFEDQGYGFYPRLLSNNKEFEDVEQLVRNRYFSDSDYHLVALLKDGKASATVLDWKGKELFSAEHKDIAQSRKGENYRAQDSSFDLWVFILKKDSFSPRSASIEAIREWLEQFGGVHLYENGLRVTPYGNPGNDWLDMNLRRVRSPEERPSTNTSIGRVAVQSLPASSKKLLIQKTDRSGYIEGEEFQELRAFAQDAMDWMARMRLKVAEQRRSIERTTARKQSTKAKRQVERVLASVPAGSREQVKEAFNSFERMKEKEVKVLRKEVQLYRTLSTAGITAATFAHESNGSPIKVISQSIGTIERRAKKRLFADYHVEFAEPVGAIKAATSALTVLSTTTLSLLNHEKRRIGRVEIRPTIENILSIFRPFLQGRDVEIETTFSDGNPYLRGSAAALESVITNLVNNSLAAFERISVERRKIRIETSLLNDNTQLRISVQDNGPGIQDIKIDDIWLPGVSTQPNGTGLGLTIVHDTVRDLGGQVTASTNCPFGGAQIDILLPILGV